MRRTPVGTRRNRRFGAGLSAGQPGLAFARPEPREEALLRSVLVTAAFALASGAALAQAPTPPTQLAPPPAPPPATAEPTPPAPPKGPAAWIRIKAPSGAEITLRCTEGETTRACAEIANGLAEKLMGGGERRREAGGGMRGHHMDGGHDMDRDGDGDRDDGDRRPPRPRGDERRGGWQ